ncbi:MAG TPA: hypothetical protein VFE19_06275 [Jatrophihabitantaceae bacterium]|jgi:hypothetical protein|nr:hypothetical protein [Jatrophihabitantaceae bacterium]
MVRIGGNLALAQSGAMSAGTSLWSALIAAVTALVVFLLTQVVVGRRERGARVYQRRRATLIEVQDAALELRNELGKYGPLARQALGGAPGTDLLSATQSADEAFALLGVKLTRIDDEAVESAVVRWRDSARFHYVSAEEVTTAEEVALWDAMNATIGSALNRP